MNRLSLLAGLILTANLPAGKIPPPGAGSPGPPGNYGRITAVAPHPSKAAVVELLEDDAAWLSRQLNRDLPPSDRVQTGRVGPWGDDCFSGGACLKVAGYQRFTQQVPGWSYPVVENPGPGEYRYLRFAWKKPDIGGIMAQVCVCGVDWHRYVAGENKIGFTPAIQVSANAPREWEIVTRDLYADYKSPHTVTGFAFTSMEGVALYDHVYLGRTIEDLDKATNAARIALRSDRLTEAELAVHFQNLSSEDASLRNPAVWAMSRDAAGSVRHMKENLKMLEPGEVIRQIREAIAGLDSPRFLVRETASKKLEEFGPATLPYLEEAIRRMNPSQELIERAGKLIEKHKRSDSLISTAPVRRILGALHVLEQAETADARTLLDQLGKSAREPEAVDEANAALERLTKRMKK